MSERPKTEAKRLKLHQTAMQVIPKWMDNWEVVPPVPRNTVGVAALHNLHERLFRTFQEDEAQRDELLQMCKELTNLVEVFGNCSDPTLCVPPDYQRLSQKLAREARDLIAKARGADND